MINQSINLRLLWVDYELRS